MGVFELEIIRSLLNLENQIASPWHHKRIALLWNLLCTSSSRGWTLQGIYTGSSTWSFYMPGWALTSMHVEHLGVIERLREAASEEGHRCGLWRSSGWALRRSLRQDWDPRKSGHLSSGSRKWAVPVKLGLKLLQMQFFLSLGSCLVSLNLEVSLSLRIMASDMHISIRHSPGTREHCIHPDECAQMFLTSLSCEKKVPEFLFLILEYSDLGYWDFFWLMYNWSFFFPRGFFNF